MIQRIQSIFLLLAMLLNLALLKVPVWKTSYENGNGEINAMFFEGNEAENSLQFFEHADSTRLAAHAIFFSMMLLSSLLLAVTIFRYQDRGSQIRLCYGAIILLFIEILAAILLAQSGANAAPLIGFALPIASVLLAWLAARFIRKDDELVKSVDRIR